MTRKSRPGWRVAAGASAAATGTAAATGLTAAVYRLASSGALALDLGWGRTLRTLGPQIVEIAAPRDIVFDVISAPYLSSLPHAMKDKLEVLERGSDMVLAAHFTPVRRGRDGRDGRDEGEAHDARVGLVATTTETVKFSPPDLISFRLVRGPVPHVLETFELHETSAGGTELLYSGELGADLWALGQWWGEKVAKHWEAAVASSFASIKAEAERRSAKGRAPRMSSP